MVTSSIGLSSRKSTVAEASAGNRRWCGGCGHRRWQPFRSLTAWLSRMIMSIPERDGISRRRLVMPATEPWGMARTVTRDGVANDSRACQLCSIAAGQCRLLFTAPWWRPAIPATRPARPRAPGLACPAPAPLRRYVGKVQTHPAGRRPVLGEQAGVSARCSWMNTFQTRVRLFVKTEHAC